MQDWKKSPLSDNDRKSRVRRTLRLIKGGKDLSLPQVDKSALDEDPFLREHFLGRRKAQSQVSRNPLENGLRYFLFGSLTETPPEAG